MKVPKVDLEEIAIRNGISIEEVKQAITHIRQGAKPLHKQFSVKEDGSERQYTVIRQGVGSLNTSYGLFWQFDFFVNDRWKKYSVVVYGKLSADFTPEFENPNKILLRIDSGCESGQKFGDVTCDCRDQLMLAMKEIIKVGEGVVINIPHQDGRGMGNHFKLATLSLQEQLRLTTVEAASVMTDAGKIDKRTYAGVIAILRFFRISQKCEIGLATNNPYKLNVFKENGYRAVVRVSAVIPPTYHTRRHLESKQLYLGHKGLVSPEEEG